MSSGLPTIIASTRPTTIAQCPMTQAGSPNIPIAAKNNVTINVVSGRVSARICVANGETANRTPAAKAPKAGLRRYQKYNGVFRKRDAINLSEKATGLFQESLNNALLRFDPSGADPNPEYTAAKEVADRHKGKII